MCLLIAGKSSQIRSVLLNTPALLADIFMSNSDGLGAMYVSTKHGLRTPKVLPNTLAECRGFIANLPQDDRNLALHWRMKTHGAIDLTNCHPYDVIPGRIALMHNGILSQGNKADTTKSDTWHYIKNIVRPLLTEAPKLFLSEAFQELVENDITTSNRFAIMDEDGELVILNKHTGISHEGIWFSNTYAWSPELLIEGYKKAYKWPSHWSYMDEDGDAEDDDLAITEDMVWNALSSCDADEVADLLDCRPNFVLRTIFADCEFTCTVEYEMNKKDEEVIKMLADEDVPGLVRMAMSGMHRCRDIAEAMCWWGEWHGKSIDKRQATSDKADAELHQELADAMAEDDRRIVDHVAEMATVDGNEHYAG